MTIFVGWLLLNGLSAMENLEKFPDTYKKTRDSMLTRYYDDSSWTGVWSHNPEGYVDSGDVILSDIDVYLQLQTAQGHVDGTIATYDLCKQLPFATDGVLFRGKVDGNIINGIAYDFIGGRQYKLASIQIERKSADESLLKFHITEDDLSAFPSTGFIRKDPDKKPMDIKSKEKPYCENALYPDGREKSKNRVPASELTHSANSKK